MMMFLEVGQSVWYGTKRLSARKAYRPQFSAKKEET